MRNWTYGLCLINAREFTAKESIPPCVRVVGIGPTTSVLSGQRSTTELHSHAWNYAFFYCKRSLHFYECERAEVLPTVLHSHVLEHYSKKNQYSQTKNRTYVRFFAYTHVYEMENCGRDMSEVKNTMRLHELIQYREKHILFFASTSSTWKSKWLCYP